MNIASILKECKQKGIILKPIGGHHLEYVGPKEVINDELLETLRQHKGQLIRVLTVLETFDGKIILEPSGMVH
jgi:hypothetical protein